MACRATQEDVRRSRQTQTANLLTPCACLRCEVLSRKPFGEVRAVRYFCTIYTHDCTFATTQGTPADGDPADGTPLARVLVSGSSKRQAAAQAYVECVGRERARLMRERFGSRLAKQETNARAIAASLRKTNRSGSECYLLDNYVESWYVHVEPVISVPLPSSPRRLRLPHPLLVRLSRAPSLN